MTHVELTGCAHLARTLPMQNYREQGWHQGRHGPKSFGLAAAVLVGSAMVLSGCVSVNAPDKPIVIELNINIKQEVVYKLTQDASDTIEKNKDIF